MYFFHFKREWHKAVLYAPLGPLIQCLADPLFQIHILCRPAEGALARPFKSAQQRMLEGMGAGGGAEGAEGGEGSEESGGGGGASDDKGAGGGVVVEEGGSDDEGGLEE